MQNRKPCPVPSTTPPPLQFFFFCVFKFSGRANDENKSSVQTKFASTPPPPQDQIVVPKDGTLFSDPFSSKVICFCALVPFTYGARMHVAMRPQQKLK